MRTPTRTGLLISIAALCVLAPLLLLPSAAASPGVTTRISISSTGEQGHAWSFGGAMSSDGRFVAFGSEADNLVPEDERNFCGNIQCREVFLRDRETGVTVTVSGNTPGRDSHSPAISADGRFVAFWSWASLVPGDNNNWPDVFVRDRVTGVLERISTSLGDRSITGGSLPVGPSISGDGRYVAFASDAPDLVPQDVSGQLDVFVYDRSSGTVEKASISDEGAEGNGFSSTPALSADGRFVAFWSAASNLVPDDSNDSYDIFVRDRLTGSTERVSVDSAGNQANQVANQFPTISDDGRFVAFESAASNLVPEGDGDFDLQIFVHDRQTGETKKVSVSSDGTEADQSAQFPIISGDGRFVAFFTPAKNLAPEDSNFWSDVFVHDLASGLTELVPLGVSGEQSNAPYTVVTDISDDGRLLVVNSDASNLVPCDTNGVLDVFMHDRQAVGGSEAQPCPAEPSHSLPDSGSGGAGGLPSTGGEPAGRPDGGHWSAVLSLAALGASSALFAVGLLRRRRR